MAAACIALLLFLAGLLFWGADPDREPGQIGGPFALMDSRGDRVTDRDLLGHYVLIYFGYTFCPDICPTTLQEMSVAAQRLGSKAARLQLVFVTVDPKRDTPEALRQYVDAIDPQIIALTGAANAVDAMLQKYNVRHVVLPLPGQPDSYLVDHTPALYLMGPSGRLVTPLRANQPGNEMASEIARHMS